MFSSKDGNGFAFVTPLRTLPSMNPKPRILLIPNVSWWIIGEMGKRIISRFGNKYDFYFLPEAILERRPELLKTIVPAVDAIHCLNESSIGLFSNFEPQALPPIATWIHHVTQWSSDHQKSVERSSAITVCTHGWQRYIAERAPSTLPVTVVPHGVDSDFFQKRQVDRKGFEIPEDRFVVGFVGAKTSDSDGGRKGTDVLLDVLRKSGAQLPNLHVLLAGPGWDDELTKLRSQGISASASGYIRKTDLPLLYSALDVYLLTSRVEGGPCTVFEAMACETAVVSTRVGAVPELIVDGLNGYSTEIDDSEALQAAIVTLGRDLEKRIAIGRDARHTVSRMSWDVVLDPLEAVYDSLIASRRASGLPQPGPSWMNDPQSLLRASCAADALAHVLSRIRKRSITPKKGIYLLREMLDKQPLSDLLQGAAMLRGWLFKEKTQDARPR